MILAQVGVTTVETYSIVAGGILALIAAFAIAVTYYRASYARATIETLKESNAALTERVTLLEADVERGNIRTATLENENQNLRSYVSGTEAIKNLMEQVTQQHSEAMSAVHEIVATLSAHLKLDHPRRKNYDA